MESNTLFSSFWFLGSLCVVCTSYFSSCHRDLALNDLICGMRSDADKEEEEDGGSTKRFKVQKGRRNVYIDKWINCMELVCFI